MTPTTTLEPTPTLHPGLEGVYLAETRLSRVDGQRGELILAGYPVEEIAPRVSFEAMVHLLWTDRLPSAGELADLRRELAARREIPDGTLELLRRAADRGVEPMDALRMAVDTLSLAGDPPPADPRFDPDGLSVLARIPALVAAHHRLSAGEEPVPASALDPEAGHAAAFLHLLRGAAPSAEEARALESYWNTVVDHGLNASTFAARVIVATGSDLVSALVGAIGALKGPLHGGAPGPALDLVLEIGSAERAEAVLRRKLDDGERLMGFGHRVYKVRDPRAEVLAGAAERLYATDGDRQLYELFRHVERVAVALLAEHKPGRNLQANVELYTALLLHGLGLESKLFTPLFAAGRAAGWIAHCREQREEGRLIRPRLHYRGDRDRRLTPTPDPTPGR